MIRGALILLAIATFIGAMMPVSQARLDDPGAQAPSDVRLVPTDSGDPDEGGEAPDPPQLSADSVDASGEIALKRDSDGHFYADVEINGAPVHFVVDTGATGIALTQDDARKAGIFFAAEEFDVIGRGASGDVRGINVAIDRARLGHKAVEDVGGVVLEGGRQSLLGQEFLSRFESVEIRGNVMTLR